MKKMIVLFVKAYRRWINPLLHALGGPTMGCRFHPTCSQYCLDAVEIHGAWRGLCLSLWRILRCHPWGKSGCDPVPPAKGSCCGSCSCQEEGGGVEGEK